MKKHIIFFVLLTSFAIMEQSCCNQAGRSGNYEVLIKSNNNGKMDMEYTVAYKETETKSITEFPSYQSLSYIVKCKDVIPQITIHKNDNAIIRVLMISGDRNVTVNNMDYYSLSELYEIERTGGTPPVSTDSVMIYYKNTNNSNYMELSASETSKTLSLNE